MSNIRRDLVSADESLVLNVCSADYNNFVYSEIWDMGRYCREKQLEYQQRGSAGRRNVIPGKLLQNQNDDEPATKKIKIDENIIERNVAFFRTHYEDGRCNLFYSTSYPYDPLVSP